MTIKQGLKDKGVKGDTTYKMGDKTEYVRIDEDNNESVVAWSQKDLTGGYLDLTIHINKGVMKEQGEDEDYNGINVEQDNEGNGCDDDKSVSQAIENMERG